VKTIKKECKIFFEEKKSKFIASIKPIQNKAEAENFIDLIKKKYSDASHNCSVFRIFNNGREYRRCDDDGEPDGTAGKPMEDVLMHMDICNVVIVATRYFGGIKLGAGGLIRNYAKTAKLAIQEGEIREYIQKYTYLIEFPYDRINEVSSILKEKEVKILEKGYNEKINYKIEIPAEIQKQLSKIKDVFLVNL
jgi:uncharacterized YigZ family protein